MENSLYFFPSGKREKKRNFMAFQKAKLLCFLKKIPDRRGG
jgi:hypothetical protein